MCVHPCRKWLCISLAEPGIYSGNKDSCRNEIRKSWENVFSMGAGVESTGILFSMKIKMMDLWMQIEDTKLMMMNLWMQIEGTKLIFIMNFSVLHFFKFASWMPQIAQILALIFKIFLGGGGQVPPPPPLRNFLYFVISNLGYGISQCLMLSMVVRIVDNMPMTWCYRVEGEQQYCATGFPIGCYVNKQGTPKDFCVTDVSHLYLLVCLFLVVSW